MHGAEDASFFSMTKREILMLPYLLHNVIPEYEYH